MELVVYGPLRGVTGERRVTVAPDGDTVGDALAALVDRYPRAARYLQRDDGTLEATVRIAIDGRRVDPGDPVAPDATVHLHPAIQGG